MAILTDIKTTNWGISTKGCGYVEQGLGDVRQCIDVLLRTQKGSDPLRPDFGSDIYQHIDKPVNLVIPNIKRAIISAIELYEQRVEVVSVAHVIELSAIHFFISYKLIDENLIDQVQLYLNEGSFLVTPAVAGSIIIEANIPSEASYQLLIDFNVNGVIAMPAAPKFGFANTSIMYAWIQANWANYGKWYLSAGKLVGYLNNRISTAKLTISQSVIYRYASPIVNIEAGQSYGIIFSIDTTSTGIRSVVSPVMGQLLNFVIANYGSFGNWSIEATGVSTDFDMADFSQSDFNTFSYQLVLYSKILSNAAITVIAA